MARLHQQPDEDVDTGLSVLFGYALKFNDDAEGRYYGTCFIGNRF
jgi:hypothetical protein